MKKNVFNMYNISLARSFLYGLAILWIMFFHSGIPVTTPVLSWIKSHGNCGVDIFFLLSGISLYFSYTKNRNLKKFYINRFLKILPIYLFIYTIFFAYKNIGHGSFKAFILQLTTLDFFLNGLGPVPWFVPAIIVFYLVYPLLYKIFFDDYKNKEFGVGATVIAVFVIYCVLRATRPYLEIMYERFAVMLLGVLLGRMVFNKQEIKLWQVLVCVLLFASTLLLHTFYKSYNIRCVFYVFMSLMFIYLFSLVYNFNKKFLKWMNVIIGFIGGFTLEIYLIHERFQEYFIKILRGGGITISYSGPLYQFSCIILSIALAVALGSLFNFVIKKIKTRKSKKEPETNSKPQQ